MFVFIVWFACLLVCLVCIMFCCLTCGVADALIVFDCCDVFLLGCVKWLFVLFCLFGLN